LLGCSALQSHYDCKARKASATTKTDHNDRRYLGEETSGSTSFRRLLQLNDECTPRNLVEVPYIDVNCHGIK